MSAKIFLDTNVLVYLYTATEPIKREIAVALAQDGEVWISTQVLQELSNILRKKFSLPWYDIVSALDEVGQNLIVFTNRPETIRDAVRLAERYGYSFYDCLILSSCLAIGCEIVYSEDMQDGQIIDGRLIIQNPFKP